MNRTLLYIDRDPAVRLLVQKGLSPAGFEVLEAEDTAQGRALAREGRPDVVLVDLDGVDMPPADLVGALRGTPGLEGAALFASTAEDRPEHLEHAASCGFTDVFVKPLDLDALASRLDPHVQPRPVSAAAGDGALPVAASGVPPLVLRTLAPLVESLVENVSAADAVLLVDAGAGQDFVVAAAHSVRRGAAVPAIGTRVARDAAPWLAEAVQARQHVVVSAAEIPAAPLIAEGITSLLVVPLAGEARTHGALLLGERRRRLFAFPPAQVEETVREAERIVFVIEQLERLRVSVEDSRREVERYRAHLTRGVAAGGPGKSDEHHDAVADLSLRVAQALGLGIEETELVRHRAQLHDAGLTWLRQAVLPHVRVSPEIRDRLLDLHGDLSAEILRGLGWPTATVQALGALPRRADAGLELAGQVVRTVTAYRGRPAGAAGRPRDRAQALAALRSEATGDAERRVVDALSAALSADGETTAG